MSRAFACIVLSLWLVSAAAADTKLPVRTQRGSVTVVAEAGMESVASEVSGWVPEALATISADLPNLPSVSKVEIRLVRRAKDLGAIAPRGRAVPKWAVGVAFRGTHIIAAAMRREHNPVDLRSTITHELAHLALDTAAGDRHLPRWLNEGFAYLHSSDFSLARSQTLTGIAWTGNFIPLSELDSRFPRREQQAHQAYAQSYDFVAFLARRGRYKDSDDDGDRWPFRDFVAEIATGGTPSEAALSSYATPLSLLFEEWMKSMRERYMLSPIGLFGIGVWALGGLLLVLAYFRKRRQGRRIIARWDEDETRADDLSV